MFLQFVKAIYVEGGNLGIGSKYSFIGVPNCSSCQDNESSHFGSGRKHSWNSKMVTKKRI